MKLFFIFILLIGIIYLSIAISKTPKTSNEVVVNYLNALAELPATKEKENPTEHFYKLFKDLKLGATADIIRKVYADEFYFNDTFKTINDIDTLIPYMVETAENVELTTVEILDVAKSETDYYIRWVMDMKFTAKGKMIDSKSTGMTQLRFNEEGKIVFHHDYWDSADGLYQHLPYVGVFVRKVKSML